MDAPEPKHPVDVSPAAVPETAAEGPAVQPDALDAIRLEVRVEELERRLRARSIELETELKAKERLRERVRELTSRVDALQETASALHREAASSTSLARELDETLKVAAEARVQLGAALEAERARRVQAESELSAAESALTLRAGELEAVLKNLTDERAGLLARAEAAEKSGAVATAELARVRDEVRVLVLQNEAQGAEARKRDEELTAMRRNLSQLRQKTSGHEAHIESLRSEVAEASAARALVESSSAETRASLEATSAKLERAEDELSAARERADALARDVAAGHAAVEKASASARILEDEGRGQRADLDAAAHRRRELEAEQKSLIAELEQVRATHEAAMSATAEARAGYESMSARVSKTDSELLAARARVEETSRALTASQASLDQARLLTRRSEDESRRLQAVIDGLQKTFDARQAAAEEKSRLAIESAEQIRREGVEAFEKAHEAQLRQDLEGERVQKELASGIRKLAVESEQVKVKIEKLKQELRARADREVAEMRLALDEERARLYADLEAEREARGKRVAPVPAENPADLSRELGEARRREIAKEVEGYLTPSAKAPVPVAQEAPAPAALVPAPAPASGVRWDEELRLLLYVAIGLSLVAGAVACAVFYQLG